MLSNFIGSIFKLPQHSMNFKIFFGDNAIYFEFEISLSKAFIKSFLIVFFIFNFSSKK